MAEFIDHLANRIHLYQKPNRIVSLVPSQTELLFTLGAGKSVVGRTKFCIHPSDEVSYIPKIGGTKTVNIERIKSLNPDLIIGNKEENDKNQIEELQKHFPVWISDVKTIQHNFTLIKDISELTFTEEKGAYLIEKLSNLRAIYSTRIQKRYKAVYLIWYNPWMTVGSDTFIHEMMSEAGFLNCYSDSRRYPSISLEELRELHPDLILLSSEPFPFKEKHSALLKSFMPDARILFVNGEAFSWYGTKIFKSYDYFLELHNKI